MRGVRFTPEHEARLRELFATGMSVGRIASAIGVSATSAADWVKRLGLTRPAYVPSASPAAQRAIPDDFRELAPTMFAHNARVHWSTNRATVHRWYKETGLEPKRVTRCVPAPADFATLATIRSSRHLAAHYGVSEHAIGEWRKETGVPSPASMEARKAAARAKAAAKPVARAVAVRRENLALRAQADGSRAGLAADHLKRIGYVPVYRARSHDRKAPPDAWIVGRRQLPEDEMIDLAIRKGFVRFDRLPVTTSEGATA